MKKIVDESIMKYAAANNLNYDELIQGVKLIEKHRAIIAKSAQIMSDWDGDNYAPNLLGNCILGILQLSTFEDPEYLHTACVSFNEIFIKATSENASSSELFEIMAQTAQFENNKNIE